MDHDPDRMEVDILFHSQDMNMPTEIMVRPEMQSHFESFLHEHDLEYEVAIDDLKQ